MGVPPRQREVTVRRKPLIADLLRWIAFIDEEGTGILQIRNEARELRCRDPEFETDGFFTARLWPAAEVPEATSVPPVTPSTDPASDPVQLLTFVAREMRRQQLQEAVGLKHPGHFRRACLLRALRASLIEMTRSGRTRQS